MKGYLHVADELTEYTSRCIYNNTYKWLAMGREKLANIIYKSRDKMTVM